MKKNTSLEKVKKLLKSTQSVLEKGLKKQLVRYDDIKDEKERKKAKQTFLLAYQAVFNDSARAVLKEFCFNERLSEKIKQSGKYLATISDETGISFTMLTAAIDGVIDVNEEWQKKIAKSLNCKIGEIFD